MIRLYGLKNCDTCRKARKWLDAEGIAHTFQDLRADGLDADALGRWINEAGWEALLNRRGTTWRGLAESDKQNIDAAKARTLMLEHPALIKRPVIEAGSKVLVGWGPGQQSALRG